MRHVVTVPKRTPPLPPPLYLNDDDNTTNPKDDDEGRLLLITLATQTPNLSPSCSVKSVRPPVPAPPKCLELNHDGDDDGVKQPPQPPHHSHPPHPPHNPNKRILSLPPGETGEPPRRDGGPHRMMNSFQSVSRGRGFPPMQSNSDLSSHRFETESNYNDTAHFQQEQQQEHQQQPRYPRLESEERWNDHGELSGPSRPGNSATDVYRSDYEYHLPSRCSHSEQSSGDVRRVEMTPPPPPPLSVDGFEHMYHHRMQHHQQHQQARKEALLY